MSKQIQLTHGAAVVDDEDFHRISQLKWHSTKVSKHSEKVYAIAKIRRKTVYMHRMVLGAQPGEEVDHISGDGLDNRRCNLRFVTSSQNKMNQGVRKDSTCRIKGISWSPERRKWQVYIQVDKKRVPLGRFETVEEAVHARREAEKEHYGEFAPELDYQPEIERLKSISLPMRELVGRGRKRGTFGIRPQSKRGSGHCGVFRHKSGRWKVRVSNAHIGYFDTFEEAVAARESAVKYELKRLTKN